VEARVVGGHDLSSSLAMDVEGLNAKAGLASDEPEDVVELVQDGGVQVVEYEIFGITRGWVLV